MHKTTHHVAFIFGENEYGSTETMPKIAAELAEQGGFSISTHQYEEHAFVDFSFLQNVDLVVIFIRFWQAEDEQFAHLHRYFESGKPAVALRTTSHGFANSRDWFPKYFGGHYMSHANNVTGTAAVIPPTAAGHPVLRGNQGFCEMGYGGTYTAQPLADSAVPLLLGKTGELPAEPIAWVNRYKDESKIFYTSLGSRENFQVPAFRNLLFNAIYWCLDREVPQDGVLGLGKTKKTEPARGNGAAPVGAAPVGAALAGAEVLFDGENLDKWRHWDPTDNPKGIRVDRRAHTAGGKQEFSQARWVVKDKSVMARPGFGDIMTRNNYRNYKLHLQFLLPEEPDYYPDRFCGASGVYLDGRYELDLGAVNCGRIMGYKEPDAKIRVEMGKWHALEIAFRKTDGHFPRLSAWINGIQIHNMVEIFDRTPYGIIEPPSDMPTTALFASDFGEDSKRFDLSADYSIGARFKTNRNGVLAAKTRPVIEMKGHDRILSIKNGKLSFEIAGAGSLESASECADGVWHDALLTREGETYRIYLDGAFQGESKTLHAPDVPWFVFKIGFATLGLGDPFSGEIESVCYYSNTVTPEKETEPQFKWERDAEQTSTAETPEGGPIRLQADCSEVRFANIWIKPLEG